MTTQTARPIRALAVMLVLYTGGRLTVAARYPGWGLPTEPVLALAREHPVPVATGARPAAPLAAAAVTYGAIARVLSGHQAGTALPSVVPPVRLMFVMSADRADPLASVAAGSAMPGPGARAAVRTAAMAAPAAAVAQTGPVPPPALALGTGDAVPTGGGGRGVSGSAWLLVRSGSGRPSLASGGGTLGGSQVGARLNWQPTALPVFLTVRASAALAQRDAEVAPGIGVRGKGVGLIVEERVPLERRRASHPAVLVYGGFDGVRAPLGTRLDGYAQAGAIGVSDPQLFVDGAVRAERHVADLGRARLGVGAGAWGAAQRGAARLDVGPQAVLHLPIGPAGARLSAEYRLGVTGQARPRSGPVLTLGADF